MSQEDEIKKLIFRIQLGGERGRRLLIRSFMRAWLAGDGAAAVNFMEAVTGGMPEKDREEVEYIIEEITSAMDMEDE